MTDEVDNPREFFARVDAHDIEPDEYTIHTTDDTGERDAQKLTVEFEIPEGERRAAALTELYDYSVKVEEPPFEPAQVYETDTLRFISSEEQVGYECVNGDKAGFVVVPPVEVVRVEK